MTVTMNVIEFPDGTTILPVVLVEPPLGLVVAEGVDETLIVTDEVTEGEDEAPEGVDEVPEGADETPELEAWDETLVLAELWPLEVTTLLEAMDDVSVKDERTEVAEERIDDTEEAELEEVGEEEVEEGEVVAVTVVGGTVDVDVVVVA